MIVQTPDHPGTRHVYAWRVVKEEDIEANWTAIIVTAVGRLNETIPEPGSYIIFVYAWNDVSAIVNPGVSACLRS